MTELNTPLLPYYFNGILIDYSTINTNLEFHEYSPVLLNLFELARDKAANIGVLLDSLLD